MSIKSRLQSYSKYIVLGILFLFRQVSASGMLIKIKNVVKKKNFRRLLGILGVSTIAILIGLFADIATLSDRFSKKNVDAEILEYFFIAYAQKHKSIHKEILEIEPGNTTRTVPNVWVGSLPTEILGLISKVLGEESLTQYNDLYTEYQELLIVTSDIGSDIYLGREENMTKFIKVRRKLQIKWDELILCINSMYLELSGENLKNIELPHSSPEEYGEDDISQNYLNPVLLEMFQKNSFMPHQA